MRASIVLLFTCTTALAAQDTVVVRANPRPVWGTVQVTRELRIGEFEGAEPYMFGQIDGVAVRGDGSILVLDGQAKTIREFDASGRHIRSHGRSGSGPGELSGPEAMVLTSNGNLIVRDPSNGRMAVFDRTGKAIAHWSFQGSFFTNASLFADTAGHVLTTIPNSRPNAPRTYGLLRYRSNGTVRDTIPWPDWGFQPRNIVIAKENSSATYTVQYEPAVVRTYSPLGYFVGGVNNRHAIDLIRLGRVTRITRDWTPVPVSGEERRFHRDRLISNIRRNEKTEPNQNIEIPATKPAFTVLQVDDEGRIWVTVRGRSELRRSPEPNQEPLWFSKASYEVVTPAGQYLATVEFPERFQPRVMRGDLVWGVERDELDVNYVSRYRIVRSTPAR